MPFVGVDIGGSFLKGAVLDPVGQALHHVVRTAGPQLKTPVRLARTLDPVQLAASVVELTNRLVEKVDGQHERLLRLFANINIFSGEPLTPSTGGPIKAAWSLIFILMGPSLPK